MWPAIISAAGNLLGGLFGKSSQEKQMEAQMDAQKEFAQEGIRWRVADAQKAGIHPLYALGANTTSFSPIGIGADPLAEGISQAGQNIARGIEAKGTAGERAYTSRLQALQLQRGELENQLLASQLARQNSPTQRPPAMPLAAGTGDGNLIPGQPATNGLPSPERFAGPALASPVVNSPMQRMVGPTGASEPGSVADIGWLKVGPGKYAPAPSADANERLEDQIIPGLAWALRNNLVPSVMGADQAKAPYKAPAGYKWRFNPLDQTYNLVPHSGKGGRIYKLPSNY